MKYRKIELLLAKILLSVLIYICAYLVVICYLTKFSVAEVLIIKLAEINSWFHDPTGWSFTQNNFLFIFISIAFIIITFVILNLVFHFVRTDDKRNKLIEKLSRIILSACIVVIIAVAFWLSSFFRIDEAVSEESFEVDKVVFFDNGRECRELSGDFFSISQLKFSPDNKLAYLAKEYDGEGSFLVYEDKRVGVKNKIKYYDFLYSKEGMRLFLLGKSADKIKAFYYGYPIEVHNKEWNQMVEGRVDKELTESDSPQLPVIYLDGQRMGARYSEIVAWPIVSPDGSGTAYTARNVDDYVVVICDIARFWSENEIQEYEQEKMEELKTADNRDDVL